MVVNALKAYGYEPDPQVVEAFTKYRKTHNEAVFDAYTADVRRCRSSHILTGLPDAYGRGRIIGDYRRVAFTGSRGSSSRSRRRSAASTLRCRPTRSFATAKNSANRFARSKNCSRWPPATGLISRVRLAMRGKRCSGFTSPTWRRSRSKTVRRCLWAGRRLSSTFTSSAIWRPGLLTEQQAQEIIDDFVIKLRIVRFLRTPEYDELFAGDPTWVTESIGGMGDDGRPLVTKTSFRFLQTLYNLGPAPEPNLTIWYSPRLPDGFRSFAAKVAIDTSSIQFESDEIMRRAWGDDGAIACCVSPMLVGKQMQFFGARANLAKCLLYAINGGRDEITGEQMGPRNRRDSR